MNFPELPLSWRGRTGPTLVKSAQRLKHIPALALNKMKHVKAFCKLQSIVQMLIAVLIQVEQKVPLFTRVH